MELSDFMNYYYHVGSRRRADSQEGVAAAVLGHTERRFEMSTFLICILRVFGSPARRGERPLGGGL